MIKISPAAPFELTSSDRPWVFAVPPDKTRPLIEALYTGADIFVTWEGRETQNPLPVGDFGGAYDQAVKFCGWQELRTPRRQPSREPKIIRENGIVEALFGGFTFNAWKVLFVRDESYCEITAPDGIAVYQSRRPPLRDWPRVRMKFFNVDAQEAAQVEQREGEPPPIDEIIAAATAAGEYGSMDTEYTATPVSLFGLREAVDYAKKTCHSAPH